MNQIYSAGRLAVIRLIPFALLAASAQGAAIFNITGTSCDSQIGGPIAQVATNNLSANSLPLSGGVQGAVLNGSCSDVVSGGGLILEASMFGNFAGSDMPLPPTVPVEFDFTITVDTLEILAWDVELYINDASYFTASDTAVSSPVDVVGAGTTVTLPGGILGAGDTWRAVASVDCLFCDGTLTIDLGNSSLRINPAQAPPQVPEPSTISLFALGAALLWVGRRRKKA